jgi:Short-chain dehydrogenases of various substrate specificities
MNAVITGASRGIGRATAEIFAVHGYDLLLCSANENRLLETIEYFETKYPNISVDGHAADLSNKEKATNFGQWAVGQAESIDILINNAGSFVQGNVKDEKDGTLEHMIAVNLYSAYYTTRAILPKMIANRSGHIFNICSIASLMAYPNGGSYSVSKFALLGFSKNLRDELKPYGIKVTSVIPGAVYTDSWKGSGVSPERIMEAEDVAKSIYNATQLSLQAVVEEIVLRPQLGDL